MHFADRPDALLALDLGAGDGWGPLCAFLGRGEPSVPFPHRFTRRERRAAEGDTWVRRLASALRARGG
jgi:hypothetical protein